MAVLAQLTSRQQLVIPRMPKWSKVASISTTRVERIHFGSFKEDSWVHKKKDISNPTLNLKLPTLGSRPNSSRASQLPRHFMECMSDCSLGRAPVHSFDPARSPFATNLASSTLGQCWIAAVESFELMLWIYHSFS